MNRDSGVAFVMITHDDRLAQAADCILLIEGGVRQNWIKPPIACGQADAEPGKGTPPSTSSA
jgi:hypothetical protein